MAVMGTYPAVPDDRTPEPDGGWSGKSAVRAERHRRQARYDRLILADIAHTYRLPLSTVEAWSPEDQIAAAASIADERERCSHCGIRPDQYPHVEADLTRCPGCEALERTRSTLKDQKDVAGLHAQFFPAEDARRSVWQFTSKGAAWRAKHLNDPGPVFPTVDEV